MALLARRRFREAPQRELERGPPLRGSQLGWAFHLRDADGIGAVELLRSPAGTLVRLRRDHVG